MDMPSVFKRVCERNGWKYAGDRAEVLLLGGRKQEVRMQLFKHNDEEMVRFYTPVGSVEALTPNRSIAALRLNFNLPHGALAVAEDKLVVADTFMLREADQDEVESSIRFISETGDRYERLIYRTDEH